jgi:hypothetical protein
MKHQSLSALIVLFCLASFLATQSAGQTQKEGKRLFTRAIKTSLTIWPLDDLYQLLRPDLKKQSKKETLIVEGTITFLSGHADKGTTVYVFPLNDSCTTGVCFYGADLKTGEMKCLNPEATTDSKGRFVIRTGPLWKITNFVVVGILGKMSGGGPMGLTRAQIQRSVDDTLKALITGLRESSSKETPFVIIPVVEGKEVLNIPLRASHNRIRLGKITLGSME